MSTTNSPPPPEQNLSGRQLGDYALIRRLGHGGMAEVYLAHQGSLQRQVAVKVLRNALAKDESYVKRFHNEAKAAAKLVHANIVQIHEVGCIEGIHFIAQEYVPGQNLKQFLAKHQRVDYPMAVAIMRQVTSALMRAADHGIVHRDIKPENIMLTSGGEVKVADFGLARAADGQTVDLTQVGITMGTPLYMSPEQVEASKVDPRSDIYSFGVTCYQMICGAPPFEGDTPLALAVQHLNNEPPALGPRRPDFEPRLIEIVSKMLQKKPENRFQSPAELLRELRALRVEETDGAWDGIEEWPAADLLAIGEARAAATQQLEAVIRRPRPGLRTNPWWVSAAGLLVSGVLLGAAVAWFNRPAPLLAVDTTVRSAVEQKDSVEDQYWHAVETNTEEAWLAVAEYYPPNDPVNELYVRRSTARLAEYYLENDLPNRAKQQYQSLSGLIEEDPYFGAVGWAGQAKVFLLSNDLAKCEAALGRVVRVWSNLPRAQRDPIIQQMGTDVYQIFDRLLKQERAETPTTLRMDF